MRVLCLLLLFWLAVPAVAQVALTPLPSPPRTFTIENGGTGWKSPISVSDDWIVYGLFNSKGSESRFYNIRTGESGLIKPKTSDFVFAPSIQGNLVTYTGGASDDSGGVHPVYEFDITQPQVAPKRLFAPGNEFPLSSIRIGDTLVYTANFGGPRTGLYDLFAFDLKSRVVSRLSDKGSGGRYDVSPDGNRVVWHNSKSGVVHTAIRSGRGWQINQLPQTKASTLGGLSTQQNNKVVAYLKDGFHLFYRPISGGPEARFSLPLFADNITLDYDLGDRFLLMTNHPQPAALGVNRGSDLFLHDMDNSKMYRLTETPTVGENNLRHHICADGTIHVVWTTGLGSEQVIHGMTIDLSGAASTRPAFPPQEARPAAQIRNGQ